MPAATIFSDIMDIQKESVFAKAVLFVFFWLAFLLVLTVKFKILYFLASIPFRRRERHRLFLDVLDAGLSDGHSPEQTFLSLSKYEDRTLGLRVYRLADYLKGGLRFLDALEQVPRLLPTRTIAMLKIGVAVGDIRKVLPACP